MKTSSLESKTVRPGLGMYSFYHSDRHPLHAGMPEKSIAAPNAGHRRRILTAIVVLLLVAGSFIVVHSGQKPNTNKSKTSATSVAAANNASSINKNHCTNNSDAKHVVIDISDRRLYACQSHKQAYKSKVITGMEKYPATLTPVGDYKIYAKVQDTVLTGADETGAWRDPVSYWMPFLDNEHGTYGFHDATWRKDSEFGAVDPYGDKASHGCIELPLATSAWLYDWVEVGTAVSVRT